MGNLVFDGRIYFLQVNDFCFFFRANKKRSISVYAPTSSGTIIFSEASFKSFVESLKGIIIDVF